MWDAQRDGIQSARWLGDYIGSSLGPNGLAKILVKSLDDFTITNDGMLMLETESLSTPTEKILAEMAESLRASSGDGSKSAIILACELLSRAESLLDRGVHPNTISRGFNESASTALQILQNLGQPLDLSDAESLRRIAEGILGSRFIGREDLRTLCSVIVKAVHIVSRTDAHLNLLFNAKDVFVKDVVGGALIDTRVVNGIVVDKEVEPDAPKCISSARIALLRASLEIEKTEWDVEVKVVDPSQVDTLMGDESRIILEKMNSIASSAPNVILCERGIDPLVHQYLEEETILAAKWIGREDMNRIARATGGTVVADISDLSSNDLGTADRVEEQDFGEKKMLVIQGCRNPKTVTILVRGPTESVVKEAERSITQVLRSLDKLFKSPKVVFGGGATEAELATKLREYATGLGGKDRAVAATFADALDSIPVALIKNSGGDVLDLLTALRVRHKESEPAIGIDADTGSLVDISGHGLIEPLSLKARVISAASEAAAAILSVDDVMTAENREETRMKKETETKKDNNKASAREVLRYNISIVKQVAHFIKGSLGPKGMMKLMVDNIGDTRVTSDGTTMLKFLYTQHPVAKLLVDAADSHSKNFGDGTKTLIILTNELLTQAEKLLNQGLQLPVIRRGYQASATLATDKIEKLSHGFGLDDLETLKKIVRTVVNEELIETYSAGKSDEIRREILDIILDVFTEIRKRYVGEIAEKFDSRKMKIVKRIGSDLFESKFVDGWVIDKEVSSNEMPKRVDKAKIAVLDYWLGITRQTLKRETRIEIRDPAAMRNYLDSASRLAKKIANGIISSEANVVFCSKRTDDLTNRFLTDAHILVVESISSEDMEALCALTGARMISDQRHLNVGWLGEADLVEERNFHGSKLVFVEGCPHKGFTCVLIRGTTTQSVDEAERILRKTIRTLIQLSKDPRIVPAGGSTELLAAEELKRKSTEISGREQLAMLAYSAALEGIPRTLYENAGLDPLETIRRNITVSESPTDSDVWDSYPQKRQVVINATNTANLILRIGHIAKIKKKPDKSEPLRKN